MNVSPTRSELQKVRNKKKLAIKGHKLLKKKQDVLTREFLEIVDDYKRYKKDIMEKIKKSYKTLAFDIAYTGIFASKSLSYSIKPQFEIKFDKRNLMGVKLPQIKAKHLKVDNYYSNSPLLADSAKQFHDLFSHLVELASKEQTIKALSAEIKKIRRRVNSLEHIQIPKLGSIEKHILFVLDEQERDNFIRLKTIKKRLDAAS